MPFRKILFFNTTRTTVVTSFLAIAIAMLALAGWIFNLEILRLFNHNLDSMNVIAALGIFFSAVSILLLASGKMKRLALLLGFIVFLLGAVSLSQYFFRLNTPIGDLFFLDKMTVTGNYSGRMTEITPIIFIVLGISLLFYPFKKKFLQRISEFTAILVLINSFTFITAYLYSASPFFKTEQFISNSLPTIFSGMLLSVGILFSRPDNGFLAAFHKKTLAARVGVKWFFIIITTLVLLGWLCLKGEEAGLYNNTMSLAIRIIMYSIIFFIVTHSSTKSLNKAEEALLKSEALYRSLVEQASDGILVTDLQGKIINVNPGLCAMFGYSMEEGLEKNISFFLDPENLKLQPFGYHFLKGDHSHLTERLAVHKNGTTFDIELNTKLIGDNKALSIIRNISERKKAEDKIRESEMKYRTLMQQAGDAILLFTGSGQLIQANQSARQLLGYSIEEYQKMSLKDLFIEEDLKENPFQLDRLNKGESTINRRRMKKKDGTVIETEIHAKKLSDGRFLGVARDLSERIKAEELIIKEKDLSDSIINSLPGVFYLQDYTGKYLRWNNSFETVSGYKAGEIKLLDPLNFFEGEERSEIINKIGEVLSKGSAEMETIIVTKTGHRIPYYLTGHLIQYEGKPCFIGIGFDISERKKAEKELKESEEKFRTLVQQAAEGIFVVDQEGNYLEANESTSLITGYSVEELKKMNAADLIPAEELQRNPLKLKEIKKGAPVFIESILRRKDGSLIHVEISAKLMDNGKVISILKDITEQRNAEKKIWHLASLVDNTADIIISHNLKLEIISWNRSAEKIYEVPASEAIGKQFIDVVSFEFLNNISRESILQQVNENGRSNCEILFINAAGKKIYLSVTLSKWYNAFGQHKGFLSIAREITEVYMAREKLETSEQFYKSLIRDSVDGTVVMDEQGYITYVAPSITNVLGYTIEETLGKRADEFIFHDDVSAGHKIFFDEINGVSTSWYHEVRYVSKDNRVIWMMMRAYNMLKNPHVKGIAVYFTDITKRKSTEIELHLSEEKYRTLVEQAVDAIFIADENGNFITVNSSACKLSGFTEKELMQKTIYDFATAEGLEKNSFYFKKLKKDKTILIDTVMKERNGRMINIEVNAKLLPDGRLLTFVRNITERKKSQQALAESETRLRTIYNTEPSCIKILGPKGELIEMNPAGLAMIEADNLDQVKGHSITAIINEPYRKAFQKITQHVFKGKQGQLEFEITGLKGTPRWLETHAVPLKNSEGKIISLLGVTRDITERKKAEEKIIKATEQLRQLTAHLQTIREDERKRIGREIHDELGQQLTAIKMDVAWIDKKTPGLNALTDETKLIKNKLQNIITLLDGSNQSVRKILNELRPGLLDDRSLLETMEWQGIQFTESTSIPVKLVTTETNFSLPEEISTCIFRIYQESLTNITRYANANKVLTSLSIKDNSIILTIKDDGKGFDTAAVQNKITFGIMGMKERVLSFNGNFDLVSSPGNGTKIMISLPYEN